MQSERPISLPLLAWVAFVLVGTVLTVSRHLDGLPRAECRADAPPIVAPAADAMPDQAPECARRCRGNATARVPSHRSTTG